MDVECQKQRKKISNIKRNTNDVDDDHKFYQQQITKERDIGLKLKNRIAESIDEYENFILGMELKCNQNRSSKKTWSCSNFTRNTIKT